MAASGKLACQSYRLAGHQCKVTGFLNQGSLQVNTTHDMFKWWLFLFSFFLRGKRNERKKAMNPPGKERNPYRNQSRLNRKEIQTVASEGYLQLVIIRFFITKSVRGPPPNHILNFHMTDRPKSKLKWKLVVLCAVSFKPTTCIKYVLAVWWCCYVM